MIYHESPSDWSDLQEKVRQIFEDMNFAAETAKTVPTVRGSYEIDVHAVDINDDSQPIHISECKLWNVKVPQAEVSAFVNVVSNYGANFGYVISKEGFQSGASAVVKNTNIKLLTWKEFQELFEKRWTKSMFMQYEVVSEKLFDYTEPILTKFITNKLDTFNQEQKERYWQLAKFFRILPVIGRQYIMFSDSDFTFPKKMKFPTSDGKEIEELTIKSKREFFDKLFKQTEIATASFDKLWNETS